MNSCIDLEQHIGKMELSFDPLETCIEDGFRDMIQHMDQRFERTDQRFEQMMNFMREKNQGRGESTSHVLRNTVKATTSTATYADEGRGIVFQKHEPQYHRDVDL